MFFYREKLPECLFQKQLLVKTTVTFFVTNETIVYQKSKNDPFHIRVLASSRE